MTLSTISEKKKEKYCSAITNDSDRVEAPDELFVLAHTVLRPPSPAGRLTDRSLGPIRPASAG
jgi:hypothetical protein